MVSIFQDDLSRLSAFQYCNKIPQRSNLKEGKVCWAHSFRDFSLCTDGVQGACGRGGWPLYDSRWSKGEEPGSGHLLEDTPHSHLSSSPGLVPKFLPPPNMASLRISQHVGLLGTLKVHNVHHFFPHQEMEKRGRKNHPSNNLPSMKEESFS